MFVLVGGDPRDFMVGQHMSSLSLFQNREKNRKENWGIVPDYCGHLEEP